MNKNYLRNVVNEGYVNPKAASKRAIYINLYNGGSEIIPADEVKEATQGLRGIRGEGGVVVYKGEEYLVVVA